MPLVSTTTIYMPQSDGTHEEAKRKIYVGADGFFYTELPEHIASVIRDIGLPTGNGSRTITVRKGMFKNTPSKAAVVSDSKSSLESDFERVLRAYVKWQQDAVAEKYLVVTFQSNVDYVKGFHDVPGKSRHNHTGTGSQNQISFIGAPTLHVSYVVLWKIGDEYFTKDGSGGYRRRSGQRGDGLHYIPYTEEREKFLEGVNSGLTNLICRITEFFEDFEGNVDTAIENNTGLLTLPAPE